MPRRRKKKQPSTSSTTVIMEEASNSEVTIITKEHEYQIPLNLVLDHSPILTGMCYGPISKIYLKKYNEETIKMVVEFLMSGNIEDIDGNENDIIRFADDTKMEKLKEYILPFLSPLQLETFMPLAVVPTPEEEVSDDESFSEMVARINFYEVAKVEDDPWESRPSPPGSPIPGPSRSRRVLSRVPSQAEEAQEDKIHAQVCATTATLNAKEDSVFFLQTSSGIRYHSQTWSLSLWESFTNFFKD